MYMQEEYEIRRNKYHFELTKAVNQRTLTDCESAPHDSLFIHLIASLRFASVRHDGEYEKSFSTTTL